MPTPASSVLRRLLPGILLAVLATLPALAQTGSVGIGTTSPDASAALDVRSTTQGLLPPRLSQAQRDAVKTPAAGLTIFNTDTGVLNTWDGVRWTAVLADTTPASASFAYTGSPQTYTVPAGVTSLSVDLAGGSGGNSYENGGRGGLVQATLAVVPGQVLTIYVGQAGQGGAGGYNGGGSDDEYGGGGGGASDVRTGAAGLADRVLVAGGGGGGGVGGAGGDGGGISGQNGYGDSYFMSGGGDGGTASAGGDGGVYNGDAGMDGAAGSGGGSYYGGGGGGGGYYGGGGGVDNGGGGGGSSYAGAGTSAVVHTQGYRSGDGYVTLRGEAPANVPAPYLDGSNITAGVIKNQTSQQVGASFNIDGTGVAGRLGVGTSQPFTQLANGDGSTNVIGSNNYGVSSNSINWTTNQPGYVAGFYNAADGISAGGLAVKLNSTSATALDVSRNAPGNNAGLSLLYVRGDGSVGVGTNSPSARLDVAGSTRLRGLATAGVVLTDANGNLTSSGTGTTGFIFNQTTPQVGASFNVDGTGTVGRLGVGTSTPTQLLEVAGPVAPAAPGTAPLLRLSRPDNSGVRFANALEMNVGTYGASGSNSAQTQVDFRLSDGQTDNPDGTVLTLRGNGNVGVGTTGPTAQLDVAGSTRLRGLTTAGVVLTDASGNLSSGSAGGTFVLNQTSPQAGASFNVAGTGTVGGLLTAARLGVGTTAPFTQLTNGSGFTNVVGTDGSGVGAYSLNWTSAEAGYTAAFGNGSSAGNANGLAVKVASATAAALDVSRASEVGTVGTALLRVGGDGNVGVGTASPATRLDVNGNLRLAVRLCPVNQPAYLLTATDVAFSVFKVTDGHFANTLTLPAASAGQVEGQELTVLALATNPCTVSNANTDVNAAVALAGSSGSGPHAVRYVWAVPASGSGYWVRVP